MLCQGGLWSGNYFSCSERCRRSCRDSKLSLLSQWPYRVGPQLRFSFHPLRPKLQTVPQEFVPARPFVEIRQSIVPCSKVEPNPGAGSSVRESGTTLQTIGRIRLRVCMSWFLAPPLYSFSSRSIFPIRTRHAICAGNARRHRFPGDHREPLARLVRLSGHEEIPNSPQKEHVDGTGIAPSVSRVHPR